MTFLKALYGAHLKVTLSEKRDRINLFYALEHHATTKGTADRQFLVYEGKSWTFREGYDTVLRYGTWLKTAHAVAPKEIVAIDFMNSPQFIFLWMGLWSIGAIPAFINYNLTGDTLLHSLKTSTTRIVFVDPEIKHQFTQEVTDSLASSNARDGTGPVQIVNFDAELEQHIMGSQGVREPDMSREAVRLDLAALVFTSGTTGLPKPGFVSWQKVVALSIFMPIWIGMKKTDRYYTVRGFPSNPKSR